jgi:hypothetical protein
MTVITEGLDDRDLDRRCVKRGDRTDLRQTPATQQPHPTAILVAMVWTTRR